jgi:hypothetical protein
MFNVFENFVIQGYIAGRFLPLRHAQESGARCLGKRSCSLHDAALPIDAQSPILCQRTACVEEAPSLGLPTK